MNIAIVGCGYVAEFYVKTLSNHPELRLVGAYDRNAQAAVSFCEAFSVAQFESLDSLLELSGAEMILNLTNPRSHYEVTRACLEAHKHVYSEKPLAMDIEAARELITIAQDNGVYLASAPCSVLGETAQTIWKALEEGVIGRVRLVYANFDDGMIAPKHQPWLWRNSAGAPWPAKDEFEVGCTFEHAGYFLTWLAAFFGPARSVTAFSSCQIPDKGIPVDVISPDFAVGCIEYDEGIVARVTCSIVAPKDKSMTIIGDDGVISTSNVRDEASPVFIEGSGSKRLQRYLERHVNRCQRRIESFLHWTPWAGTEFRLKQKYPFARQPRFIGATEHKRVDFCRGPAEMSAAIRENRPCRLSAELGLHVTELVDALQYPDRFAGRRLIQSTFTAMEPLVWGH